MTATNMGQAYASPGGDERVSIGDTAPGWFSVFLSQLRDSAGYLKATPVTGATISPSAYTSEVELNPAGTIAACTVVFPSLTTDGNKAPADGAKLFIFSSQIISTLTLTPGAGQTINNTVTSMTAAQRIGFLYSQSNTTWDRIQ